MRLRPFGDSGPLVLSFAALEDYYQEQGRDWERYAMVKARIMGDNDGVYAGELRAMLRPFVFRRYIDFSVIQSLRNMKGMIAREVRRRGLKDNIKLGAGGIREVEFIVQVFQLIRGGREPMLQQRALLPTLAAIEELHLLPEGDAQRLREAYLFCDASKTCCRVSTMSRRKLCRRMSLIAPGWLGGWALPTGRRSARGWRSRWPTCGACLMN